jgi:hypothetical protein
VNQSRISISRKTPTSTSVHSSKALNKTQTSIQKVKVNVPSTGGSPNLFSSPVKKQI